MAGIFPPAANNGQPPGPNVCNGFTPTNPVTGEGPRYFSNDCTTILPDCVINSMISEMLALVDGLGMPWNANRVDNLYEAVSEAIAAVRVQYENFIDRRGDTMTGPLGLSRDPQDPLEAATKRYVDQLLDTLNTTLRQYVDDQAAAVTAAWTAMASNIDARKINRSGDTMAGPLILSRSPVFAMEAATKAYIDTHPGLGSGGGGPGGGIPEAPYDDSMYGRINQTWQRIIDDGSY